MTPAPFGAGASNRAGVYLLHFERVVKGGHMAGARHYIGFTSDIERRLQQHASGEGSQFTKVAFRQGIGFQMGNFWPGADEGFETKLKGRNEASRICTLCPKKPRPRSRRRTVPG